MSKPNDALRVLHAAAFLKPSPGIWQQMVWEQEAAHAVNIPWTVRIYCPQRTDLANDLVIHDPSVRAPGLEERQSFLCWFKLRRNYYGWLKAQKQNYDLIVLRYHTHDPFQLRFVYESEKPVLFVHHSLEVPELISLGTKTAILRATTERIIGPPSIRRSKGVIGVTREIVDYELDRAGHPKVHHFIYPNGIRLVPGRIPDQRDPTIPELCFIAGEFTPWQGLDLLLNSISSSKEKFRLHVIGRTPSSLQYDTQDSRVIYHGLLNGSEISSISQVCWLGIASLALDRKNMREACPLKTREYLSLGLPVYGGYSEAVKDIPYYTQGPAEIGAILETARQHRSISKSEIAERAQPSISKELLLTELYVQLQLAYARTTSSPSRPAR